MQVMVADEDGTLVTINELINTQVNKAATR
jgi:hypothetical protein